MRCADCQTVLLDRLYGLLEEAEAAAVDAHVAGCAECAGVRADASRAQGLFARAAKLSVPRIAFVPPPPGAAPPPEPSRRLDEAAIIVAADRPESPNTVRRAWVNWAVAAGLLLAVCGIGGPTVQDVGGYWLNRRAVQAEYAKLKEAEGKRRAALKALDDAKLRAAERVKAAEAEHNRVADQWVKAEGEAIKRAAERPFVVEVRGPAVAIPGAPNDYLVKATDKLGRPKPVTVTASVRGGPNGKTAVYETTFPAGEATTVRLPADLWNRVPAGGDPALHISAKAADGTTVELSEPVRLLDPIYTTHLATDKPLYRPGETIYFRSLTLDRTRFQPPGRDISLRFELVDPAGNPVMHVVGQAKPAEPGQPGVNPALVPGPDGRPVRGVGCGEFLIPGSFPGGVYQLRAFEVAANTTVAPAQARPVATVQVIVATYTPDNLEKALEFDGSAYGPGDVVQAKLLVAAQKQPVRNATVSFTVKADGQPVTPEVASAKVDANGAAVLRFTLPKGDEVKTAEVTATVTSGGVTETLVRPVPLVSRRVTVDFFPEGGDLVAGLANRVYVRATTAAGKPADISGVLTDGTRDIARVETLRDASNPGVNQGLGVFTFTPVPGRRYAVRLDKPAGLIHPEVEPLPGVRGYLLPEAKAEGVVLAVPAGVTKPGQPVMVQLGYAGKGPMQVMVGGYVRGRAVAHATAILTPGQVTPVTLDLGAASVGGVMRVTVFELPPAGGPGRDDLRPVAERLVFRRSGEALQLGFTAKREGRTPTGFHPGDSVTLDITARREDGRPTGAVLYAAVTNRSTRVMAGDKALRTLPTHFLLGGEVRTAADLENTDFLLTDHPQAAAGLDLLLGTQGWRRFAEQSPEQFRLRTRPADADALLASIGGLPGEWRSDVLKTSEQFWPKYEAAAAAWDAARAAAADGPTAAWAKEADELAVANNVQTAQYNRYAGYAERMRKVYEGIESRRFWLPVTVLFTLGVAVLCGLAVMLGWVRPVERKPLAVGAVGFGLLGLLVVVATMATLDGSLAGQLASVQTKPTNPGPAPKEPDAEKMVPFAVKGGGKVMGDQQIPWIPPKAETGPLPDISPELLDARPRTTGTPPVKVAPQLVGNPFRDRLLRYLQEKSKDDQDNIPNYQDAFTAIRQSSPASRPLVVREYAHVWQASPTGARRDFTETVFWHPVLVLPDTGTGTVKFDLSDSLDGYEVTVAGHTLDGRLGVITGTLRVQKPVAVDVKLPAEIGSADALDLPVIVTNQTAEARAAGVRLRLAGLAAEKDETHEVSAPAAGSGRQLVRVRPTVADGPVTVTANADAGPGFVDAVQRTATVVPDGFPVTGAESASIGRELTATVKLPADRIPGTTAVSVTLYPNTLADLRGGLDGLLREPHGCFEQSSTANYPNVLALSYLGETKTADPDLSRRAKSLLATGYTQLARFECPDTPTKGRQGFEWFGAADRPHEALTAYGLLQFTDMAAVYPVDRAMLERTKAFLLGRRDGVGGFTRNPAALDTFGRAPQHLTDAYIVWAISDAERNESAKSDLTREVEALMAAKAGPAGGDPYFLSLLGNALVNLGRKDDAVAVLREVGNLQATDGSVPGAKTSITASAGRDLVIETTALAVLGWLKAERPDQFLARVVSGIRWLIAQRGPSGTFGSSQSTILALKALVAHARANNRPPEAGSLTVFVGGRKVETRAFDTASGEPVVVALPNPERLFAAAETPVRVELASGQAYPVTVAWSARTRKPADGPKAVKLTAALDRDEVQEGQSVRLTVRVENVTAGPHGMVVAVVGLPAGLRLPADAKQLKELTAGPDPKLAFWEVRGRELVLYWRGLPAKGSHSVAVELIADVPGEFRGPASRAYPYYNADAKHWAEPLSVRVKP